MKKLLISTLILTAMVPHFAFAAWWNPFSWDVFGWFHKESAVQTVVEVPIARTTKVVAEDVAMRKTKPEEPSPQDIQVPSKKTGFFTPILKKNEYNSETLSQKPTCVISSNANSIGFTIDVIGAISSVCTTVGYGVRLADPAPNTPVYWLDGDISANDRDSMNALIAASLKAKANQGTVGNTKTSLPDNKTLTERVEEAIATTPRSTKNADEAYNELRATIEKQGRNFSNGSINERLYGSSNTIGGTTYYSLHDSYGKSYSGTRNTIGSTDYYSFGGSVFSCSHIGNTYSCY